MKQPSDDAPPEGAREGSQARRTARGTPKGNHAPGGADQRGEAAMESTFVEDEIASLSPGGVLLASRLLRRIAEIERASGPEVAEAVVERLIDVFQGRRRVFS